MSVYRINFADGHFYFGSTCSSLQDRLWSHKGASKVHPNRKLYTIAKDWNGATIEEIEKVDGDRTARRIREQFYIDQYKTNHLCVNECDAFCSDTQLKEKKAMRQIVRRAIQSDEDKERKRLRHNELQKIRRANKTVQ